MCTVGLLAIIKLIIFNSVTHLLLWALTENVSSQEHLKWNLHAERTVTPSVDMKLLIV